MDEAAIQACAYPQARFCNTDIARQRPKLQGSNRAIPRQGETRSPRRARTASVRRTGGVRALPVWSRRPLRQRLASADPRRHRGPQPDKRPLRRPRCPSVHRDPACRPARPTAAAGLRLRPAGRILSESAGGGGHDAPPRAARDGPKQHPGPHRQPAVQAGHARHRRKRQHCVAHPRPAGSSRTRRPRRTTRSRWQVSAGPFRRTRAYGSSRPSRLPGAQG
mmetsp:Transcript_54096/g.113091  ORF Transcript_54096/g.113091 Transcript_54096/m.113091 type:complete len:221 (-) Transcript_54096:2119-2781(-)